MTNYEFSLRHAAVYDPRLPRQLESPRLLRRSCPLRQRLAADVRGGFAEVLCGVGQHLVLELSTKVRESRRQDLTKGCMSAMIINQLAALRMYARYKPGTAQVRCQLCLVLGQPRLLLRRPLVGLGLTRSLVIV